MESCNEEQQQRKGSVRPLWLTRWWNLVSPNMYSFIESFRGLAKQEHVAIDNVVFRLHYRYTVCLLFLCSGLLTANQLFGNPMTCYMRGGGLPERMVTNYCWVTATYTLKHINQPVIREVEDLSDGEKQFVRRFVSLG